MKEIKLLIVEDDRDVLDSFKETIERIERDSEIRYKIYEAINLDKALAICKYNKLDIATIDLNLSTISPDNTDGNKVISAIIDKFRILIIVISGEPSKLDSIHKDNKMIKLFARDENTSEIFKTKIPDLLNSKTLKYFSRNGYLEKKINDFYWKNIQVTIESWNEIADSNPKDIDKILSRHTVANITEELYVDGNIGSFDKFHPAEVYIMPRIKKHYHTGDIVIDKDKKNSYIILNPACDIVNKINLDYYILVHIINFNDLVILSDKIKNGEDVSINFYDKLNKKGKSCYNDCKSNKKDRFHYLPNFGELDERLIDFQRIKNIGKTEINKFEAIASISPLFLKDIIARFSSYYARQGQPNLML